MLKRQKAITGDGSIRIVKPTSTHADTTAATGDPTRCIHTALTCPLGFRIIHTLGFTDTDITATRLTTAITGDITRIRTFIDGITVGVGIHRSHYGRTIKGICDLKIGVLGVHAA